MRCLYSSDLHGNTSLYERLFEHAAEPGVGALLLGGDLSPLIPPLDVMKARQREFFEGFLHERCGELVASGRRVILIPGNDDLRTNDEALRYGQESGVWELIDGEVVSLGQYALIGCGTIPLTPFILKDRETWDVAAGGKHADALAPDDANALRSVDGGSAETLPTLASILERLYARVAGRTPTILMAHCPPRGTRLDVLWDGRHVGSDAVRAVIERHRPKLGLHGHIHESPLMDAGSWIDWIGESVVVNPGSSYHEGEKARLHLVSFDTDDIDATIRYDRE